MVGLMLEQMRVEVRWTHQLERELARRAQALTPQFAKDCPSEIADHGSEFGVDRGGDVRDASPGARKAANGSGGDSGDSRTRWRAVENANRGYVQSRKSGDARDRNRGNDDGDTGCVAAGAAKGANLVITHEPTFYNHLDRPEGMDENDAVWKEKREFIEKNGLVVWRFHDHWHLRTPDGILAGVVKSLGWEKYQSAENPHLFTVPEITLEKLAADVAKQLDTPVLRVVGIRR